MSFEAQYKFESKEELEKYFEMDLYRLEYSIERFGYVCQDQYEKLNTYVCENNCSMIMSLLTDKTGREVYYSFTGNRSNIFVFFDKESMTSSEAEAEADAFAEYLQW